MTLFVGAGKMRQYQRKQVAVVGGHFRQFVFAEAEPVKAGFDLNRRFNAAKELLRFTIQPMSEVITESGIGNEDLFYQLFRENENMTPEEYRKNWAQWIKD